MKTNQIITSILVLAVATVVANILSGYIQKRIDSKGCNCEKTI